jgi:DNA-binding transcriptional LysR family regulator
MNTTYSIFEYMVFMDKFIAMRAFVRVALSGSFSAAARDQNSSQATISKRVAALEESLGVKLLSRTSRNSALTQAGAEYYEHCVALLAEMDEVEAQVRSQHAAPQGVLRVTAPVAFGRLVLAPLVSEFLQAYPDIQLDMSLVDKQVDLIAEGMDIAIRARKLEDSSLIARPLFDNPMLLVASPKYITVHGIPEQPVDLTEHNCIVYSLFGTSNWLFRHGGKEVSVPVSGSFRSDSGDTNLEVALTGLGITQSPFWMVEEHLRNGRLVRLLPDYQPNPVPFNAVYPHNRYVPLKVRCFIDFLKMKIAKIGGLSESIK